MKKKKYLPLYYKWCQAYRRDCNMYLCNAFLGDDLLELFRPTRNEENELWKSGWSVLAWAEGETEKPFPDYNPRNESFPPLRRNILLFLAAMSGELDNNNHEKPRRKKK